MNISDLINNLEIMLATHGDMPVLIDDGDTISNLHFVSGDAEMGHLTASLTDDHVSIERC
tara:strand:- start:3501 stop:3680 length:180 start_codon:yes stop_codon:yes gene_type:complete